jgi:hypothetical protein
MPGFWMYETTGVLRPAVEAYLADQEMTGEQIAAMRAYLRQWINAPWGGGRDEDDIDKLRARINKLVTRAALHDWIMLACDAGIDPL